MINEFVKVKGRLSIVLMDETGNVKQQEEKNLVVNSGLAFIISRMKDTTDAVVSHLGVGSGATAAAATDTALETEITRVALDSTTIITTTVTNDTIQYVASFPAGTGTGAITEMGLFNAGAAGTMPCRTVFPVINKGALDTMVVTWKVTVA